MQTNEKTSRKKREIDTSNPIHRLKLTKEETVEIRAKTSKLKLLKLRVNSDDFDKLKQICANTSISRDFTFSALLTCSKKKVLELDFYETLSLSFTKFTHFDDKKLEKNASKINLRLISYTSVKSSLKNGLINRSIVCLSVI